MHAYSFDIESLKFIDNNLAGRKQRVKIKSSSDWSELHYAWGPSRINIGLNYADEECLNGESNPGTAVFELSFQR